MLAGRDLAARCAEGQLDAKRKVASRARRKRALTAESSSRWAGAITRVSEDQYRLAGQNLRAERASLHARVTRIEERLAVRRAAEGGCEVTRPRRSGTPRTSAAGRCEARLARAERRIETGSAPVTRGGRALLRKRASLAAAGLTEQEWRAQWEAARWFLTADGEKDSLWGNQTIRFNPDQGWLEVKLPAPLLPGEPAARPLPLVLPGRVRLPG